MRRRDLLRWSGGVAAVAVAGCLEGDDDDGVDDSGSIDETPVPEEDAADDDGDTIDDDEDATGDDEDTTGDGDTENDLSGARADGDPVTAVETFIEAWQDGDVETVNTLLYEDGELEEVPDDEADEMAAHAPTIEEIALDEEDGGTARVETVLAPPDDDYEPVTTTFELTAVDEGWRIVDIIEESEDRDRPGPETVFDVDVDNGTLRVMHVAGDAVPAEELVIRGDGLSETGSWDELSDEIDERDEVTAGTQLSVDVEDEYTISVIWTDPDTDESVTLHNESGVRESDSEMEDPVDSYLSNTPNYDGSVEDFTGEDEVVVLTGSDIEGYEEEFVYDPPAIRIDERTDVIWEIADQGGHTVTHEDGEFDSELLTEGETFRYTFEETGTYRYYCEPHRSLGQKGVVIVE